MVIKKLTLCLVLIISCIALSSINIRADTNNDISSYIVGGELINTNDIYIFGPRGNLVMDETSLKNKIIVLDIESLGQAVRNMALLIPQDTSYYDKYVDVEDLQVYYFGSYSRMYTIRFSYSCYRDNTDWNKINLNFIIRSEYTSLNEDTTSTILYQISTVSYLSGGYEVQYEYKRVSMLVPYLNISYNDEYIFSDVDILLSWDESPIDEIINWPDIGGDYPPYVDDYFPRIKLLSYETWEEYIRYIDIEEILNIKYEEGFNDGQKVDGIWDIGKKVFAGVAEIMNIEIVKIGAVSVTLGNMLFIPLMIAILTFILKWFV